MSKNSPMHHLHNPMPVHPLRRPQQPQHGPAVRADVDARAHLAQLARLLVDGHVDGDIRGSQGGEGYRGAQAAWPAADDGYAEGGRVSAAHCDFGFGFLFGSALDLFLICCCERKEDF